MDAGVARAMIKAHFSAVSINARRLWMRFDHFLNCHFLSLPVRAALDPASTAVCVPATRVATRSTV